MAADTSVKYFASTMTGAPVMNGTNGSMTTVLDGCLINGFGGVTINTLAVSSGVATCTVNAGHNFAMIGNTGPVITITGASPSGLNGDKRITVTSGNIFTYDATGISNTTTSGTATRAPLGFTKVYSGTNKAVYKSSKVDSTGKLLRVDDVTDTRNTYLKIYDTMSDIDTGTDPAPVSGSYYGIKSSTSDSTARAWVLFGDEYFFFLVVNISTNTSTGGFYFGDPIKLSSTDQHCCVLGAATTVNSTVTLSGFGTTTGRLFARSYTGVPTGSTILHTIRSGSLGQSAIGIGGETYPSVVTNGINLYPIDIYETLTTLRAIMPGIWNPIHANPTGYGGTTLTNIPQLADRTLLFLPNGISVANFVPVDITGPWRNLYV